MKDILVVCLPVILSGISSFLVWRMQKSFENVNKNGEALKLLLKCEMRQMHEHHTKLGHIRAADMGEYNELFDAYEKLGGNHLAKVWKEDLERLGREHGGN